MAPRHQMYYVRAASVVRAASGVDPAWLEADMSRTLDDLRFRIDRIPEVFDEIVQRDAKYGGNDAFFTPKRVEAMANAMLVDFKKLLTARSKANKQQGLSAIEGMRHTKELLKKAKGLSFQNLMSTIGRTLDSVEESLQDYDPQFQQWDGLQIVFTDKHAMHDFVSDMRSDLGREGQIGEPQGLKVIVLCEPKWEAEITRKAYQYDEHVKISTTTSDTRTNSMSQGS